MPAAGRLSSGIAPFAPAGMARVLGRSSGGSAHYLTIPESCTQPPLTVNVLNLTDLAGICTVNLGYSPDWDFGDYDGFLKASLPHGYTPSISGEQMLDYCLPDWSRDVKSVGDDVWHWADDVILDFSTVTQPQWTAPGLFWNDEEYSRGYFYYALRYALVTLYTYAELGDNPSRMASACSMSASTVRKAREVPNIRVIPFSTSSASNLKITVNSDYEVELNRTYGSPQAFTPNYTIYLGDQMQCEAALADYYFWQATRLYSHAVETGGDLWYAWVAMNCARAALSELVEMAGSILHEYAHWAGNPKTLWECSVLGAKLDCCHYVLEYYFRNRMWAKHGLVPSLGVNGASNSTYPATRYSSSSGWSNTLGGLDNNCTNTGMQVTGSHDNVFNVGQPLSISWKIPSSCSTGSDSGSDSFND